MIQITVEKHLKTCRKFDIPMLNKMFNVSEWNSRTYKSEIFGYYVIRNLQIFMCFIKMKMIHLPILRAELILKQH